MTRSDPVCINARLFLPVAALPQWELSMKVAQLLGLQGPWQRQLCRDMDSLHWSYGPIRVFFPASCSWRSEDLFGQSSSIALPIQALRGLPCLGSFSVVLHVRHIEGPPCLGSYCVVQRISHQKVHPGCGPTLFQRVRHLMDQPLCCSVANAGLWGERGYGHGSTPYTWLSGITLLPWLPGFPPSAFSTVISSLTSPQSVSPQSTAAFTLGLLHNP